MYILLSTIIHRITDEMNKVIYYIVWYRKCDKNMKIVEMKSIKMPETNISLHLSNLLGK